MVDDRKFKDKYIICSLDNEVYNSDGIVPDKIFDFKSRYVKLFTFEREDGMVAANLLVFKSKCCINGN